MIRNVSRAIKHNGQVWDVGEGESGAEEALKRLLTHFFLKGWHRTDHLQTLGPVHTWQLLPLLTTITFFFCKLDLVLSTALSLSCPPPIWDRQAEWAPTCASHCVGKFPLHLISPPWLLGAGYHHPSFIDGETGVLRTWANCPRSSEQLSVQVCSQSLQALPWSCVLCALGSRPHSLYWDLLSMVLSQTTG